MLLLTLPIVVQPSVRDAKLSTIAVPQGTRMQVVSVESFEGVLPEGGTTALTAEGLGQGLSPDALG